MKTQMRFQKILMIISVVIAAFGVVFALIFNSSTLMQITLVASDKVEGSLAFVEKSQAFSDLFLTLGIVLILVVVLMIIMGCGSRRKYYITNYVATGIAVAYMVIFAILLVVYMGEVVNLFDKVDLAAAEDIYTASHRGGLAVDLGIDWTPNPWSFAMGYALMALVLVDAVVIVLNLIWKILLMKGEKKLLQDGLVEKEAV